MQGVLNENKTKLTGEYGNYHVKLNSAPSVMKLSDLLKICGQDSLITRESEGYVVRATPVAMAAVKKLSWVKDVCLYEISYVTLDNIEYCN